MKILVYLPESLHSSIPLFYFMFMRAQSCLILETLWTVVQQATLSMEFSRKVYWSRLPCPSPGNLSDPEIEHTASVSPVLADRFFITSATWEGCLLLYQCCIQLLSCRCCCVYVSMNSDMNTQVMTQIHWYWRLINTIFRDFFAVVVAVFLFIFISWRLITSQHFSGHF